MITVTTYILLVFIMGVLYSMGFAFMGYIVVPSIIILSICVTADFFKGHRTRMFGLPLTLGYLWRLALLFLDLYGRNIYELPNSGKDSEMFFGTARAYAISGEVGRGGSFSTVLGTLFKIIGPNRLFGQYTILLFSIITMCIFAWIVYEFNVPRTIKIRSMYLVALLPNVAIISSIFLRESIVAMFVAFSIYLYARWYNSKNEIYFYLAIVAVFIGSLFHSGVVAIAVGFIIARFLYDKQKDSMRSSASGIIISIICFIIFVFLYLNYFDTFFEEFTGLESIADVANTSTRGGSSYAKYVGDSSNIFSLIVYTIPRIVYFLFSPFPWQWRGLDDIIAFCFGSLFYLVVCVDAFKYLKNKQNKNNKSFIILMIIVALAVTFVFAWGVSNTGTAARHREKLIIIYATLYLLTHRENGGIILKAGNKRIF